jgi:hypothetical protein
MAEHVAELPFDPLAPRVGRRVVMDCLEEDAEPAVRDAVLVVVSELVTHAVQRTRPPLRLRCANHDRVVFIHVDHGGPYVPLEGMSKRVVDELASRVPIRPASGRLGFQAAL